MFQFQATISVTHSLNYVLIVITLKLSLTMFVHSASLMSRMICGREVSSDQICQTNTFNQLLSIKMS